jgi:hypothetical protein
LHPAFILPPAKKVTSLHASKTGKDRSHPQPLNLGEMIAHLLIKDICVPKIKHCLLFTLILLHKHVTLKEKMNCSSFVPRILANKSPTHSKSASLNLQSPILNHQSPILNATSIIVPSSALCLSVCGHRDFAADIDLPTRLF